MTAEKQIDARDCFDRNRESFPAASRQNGEHSIKGVALLGPAEVAVVADRPKAREVSVFDAIPTGFLKGCSEISESCANQKQVFFVRVHRARSDVGR